MFDERLTRNQDIELNKRILRAGGKIYLVPDTYCVYMARESYRALAKNNYGNGKWNIWTVYYTGQLGSLSLRHFIPLLFVLSLIVPLLADILYWPLALISLLSLVSYISLIGAISAKLSISKKLNFMYLLFSFIVLHLSYGIGSLIGILCLPFLSKKK
jgi:GT2 family glycosyltransferase